MARVMARTVIVFRVAGTRITVVDGSAGTPGANPATAATVAGTGDVIAAAMGCAAVAPSVRSTATMGCTSVTSAVACADMGCAATASCARSVGSACTDSGRYLD
jgi:hypothetical protein